MLGLLGKRISRYNEINYVCWDKIYSLNSTPCDSCQRLDETDYKCIVIHVIGFVVFDQILLLQKDVQYMFKHKVGVYTSYWTLTTNFEILSLELRQTKNIVQSLVCQIWFTPYQLVCVLTLNPHNVLLEKYFFTKFSIEVCTLPLVIVAYVVSTVPFQNSAQTTV